MTVGGWKYSYDNFSNIKINNIIQYYRIVIY